MDEFYCPQCGELVPPEKWPLHDAAAKIAKLEADNEELIRGMTEMAERFTAAMDKARLSPQPQT